MARERWTDEAIDKAFDRVDADLREIRVEMRKGFEQIDKRFERVDDKFGGVQAEMSARFDLMNSRFDAMQRTMIIGFVTLQASMIGGVFAALGLA